MIVIGEAQNGKEVLEFLKVSKPDVVLLDIEMPLMNGKETLEIIKKRFPETRVIMLSMHFDASYINEFMVRGARGYLAKGCDPETLFEAIRAVKKDGHFFGEKVAKAMLNGLQKERTIAPLLSEIALSDREIDILKEICTGKTNKEIAATLKISASTVDFHKQNIYRKTNSGNVTELVKYAIKNAIVSLD
ncbi:MAG: DNA-binding response regulator [Bacteroidetes bacterium]|jgi:DNA-binding NarL/FixJ family response regulator|nr:DNA-binding response regulator [Bacteroidota bacterium]